MIPECTHCIHFCATMLSLSFSYKLSLFWISCLLDNFLWSYVKKNPKCCLSFAHQYKISSDFVVLHPRNCKILYFFSENVSKLTYSGSHYSPWQRLIFYCMKVYFWVKLFRNNKTCAIPYLREDKPGSVYTSLRTLLLYISKAHLM